MKKLVSLLLMVALLAGIMAPMVSAEGTDITILFENDIHSYIDWSANKDKDSDGHEGAHISYATLAEMKAEYQAAGKDVIVVDAGDHMDAPHMPLWTKARPSSRS